MSPTSSTRKTTGTTDDPTILDQFIAERLPGWLRTASREQARAVSAALIRHQASLEALTELFQLLQSPDVFAAPLLDKALRDTLGLQLDTRAAHWKEVRLRQYRPGLSATPMPYLEAIEIQSPLLQRALQNFSETAGGYWGFFRGTAIVSAGQALGVAPERFAGLCRTLDLGQKYQAHLDSVLDPPDDALKRQRHALLAREQRDQLDVAAQVGYLKKDIDEVAYRMLRQVVDGASQVTYAEHPVRVRSIEVLGQQVQGAVAFLARGEPLEGAIRWTEAGLVRQVVVFLPGDPQRPLRQYPTWYACATDLGLALKSADYLSYFQSLISLQERAAFGAAWQAQRDAARPDLELLDYPLAGELFASLAQWRIARLKADAAVLAVPTARVDDALAEARREAYLAAGETLLGIAASFVPGVGQIMLLSSVGQLLGEVYEGAVDWSKGQRKEALAHLTGVAENVLASVATGAGVAGLVAVAKRSAFVDGLMPIVRSTDQYRLWNEDLASYRHAHPLPETLVPRSDGLYEDAGALWLRHEGQTYQVQQRDGRWVMVHPQRAEAYSPGLETNGEGAWRLPGEHALQWAGNALLVRRLGPLAEGLSDAQIDQVMVIAGMDEARLRGLHVENRGMPVRLRDTLVRFGIDTRISTFFERLHRQTDAQGLDPVLHAFCREHLQGVEDAGQDSELDHIWEQMPRLRFELFEHLEAATLTAADSRVSLLQRDFPGLARRYAQALAEQADATQRQMMDQTRRIPLAVAEQARHTLREARLSRALEGLCLQNVHSDDSVGLAFGLLRRMPAWPDGLNLELREGSSSGRVIERQLSLSDTRQTRVLVRRDGQFSVYDTEGYEIDDEIPAPQGMFEAIACCLTREQRRALGWTRHDSAAQMREALAARALANPSEAAQLIGQARSAGRFSPPQRLPDGRIGYPLSGRGSATRRSLVSVVRVLFPGYDQLQIDVLLTELQGGSVEPMTALMRLLDQYQRLDASLQLWCREVFGQSREWRRLVADELRRCWRRQTDRVTNGGGTLIGYRLNLVAMPVGHLPPLGAGIDFSHVIDLSLVGMGLTELSNSFLQRFVGVRWLNLANNRFGRIPPALNGMNWLREVNLNLNQINLRNTGVNTLASLHRLEVLNLDNNPIEILPNMAGMYNLRHVWLRSTRLQLFPTGLLECPFLDVVDLRDNLITQLPETFFVPESLNIYLLQRNPLPQATWDRINDLQQLLPVVEAAAGVMVRAETTAQARALWLELANEAQLDVRSRYWDSLIAEPGAADFFQLLTELTGSADFQHTRAELDQRVWRMLEAMAQHTALREELFELAASPTTCVDSVSSTYSALEVRYLLFQTVRADSPNEQQGEALLAFARRLFRLEQVEQFARADIQARTQEARGVDEVEVSLAYRTRLAAALDLPGQPRNMQFAEVAAVAPAQIHEAQRVVLAAEQTDQLATFISGRDFWLAYLRQAHEGEFEQVEQPFWDRLEVLAAQQGTLQEGVYLTRMNALRSEREAAVQALALRLTQAALEAAAPPAG